MVEDLTDAVAQVVVASTGEAFACEPGETLLKAGLRSGLNLPYECASGACGSCRCKLVEGEVESLWQEAPGLSERDRRRGNMILMCQSLPAGDVTIDLRVRPPVDVPRPLSTFGIVSAVRMLTHDMVHLTIIPDEAMPFLPGQFVIVDLPGLGRRAYSMANVDPGGCSLEFIVKVKPGGAVSGAFAERSAVGVEIRLEGPYGGAYYRSDVPDRPVVGIAGGSGLAPVWSIAQAAARDGHRTVTIYFGVNGPRDMCFAEEFADLSGRGAHVTTHLIVRDDAPSSARAGLVGDAVIDDLPDLTSADVYMAGPPQMIDAILGRLVAEGRINSDRVFFDRFC